MTVLLGTVEQCVMVPALIRAKKFRDERALTFRQLPTFLVL